MIVLEMKARQSIGATLAAIVILGLLPVCVGKAQAPPATEA